MTFITLNVLPYAHRHAHERRKGERFVLFFAVIACFFFLVSVVFVVANAALANMIGDLSAVTVSSTNVRDQVRELNKKVRDLNEIQSRYDRFTQPLVALSAIVPADIELEQIILDASGEMIRITGVAMTRESLFQLKNDMQSSGMFLDVQFSTGGVLSRDNTPFKITARAVYPSL